MNKIKRISFPFCLLLIGMGILLLGVWDMQNATAAEQNTWYQGTDAPTPVLFYGHAQCVDDPDVFYVIGSYPGASHFYRYDANTDTWDTIGNYPINIERSAVVCYGGKLYVAGGDSGPGAIDSLNIYDFDTDTWTQGANLPHPLKQAAVGVWSGHIYLVGGTQYSAPWTPFNHVDVYDIATDTWTDQGGDTMPVASSSAGYTQMGRYLYVVGGWSGNFDNNVDATLRYDMSSDTWESGPVFTSARAAFDLVATDSNLYAIGGDADGDSQYNATDLVEALDLSTWPDGGWVDIDDPLPLALEGSAGFCSESVSGGEIWSIGGSDGVDTFPYVYYRPTGEPCYDWPPQVLALNPAPESHDADVTTPISITYDMDMDPTTVIPGSFSVHARQTGWLTETLSVDGGTITLQPTNPLHAGELVQVTATTATLSLDGEAPVEPTVWEFTTAPWSGNAYLLYNQTLPSSSNRSVSLGDLDGDGDLDAFTTTCSALAEVYFNDGKGTFTLAQSITIPNYCMLDVDLGDLDGDGDLDAFLVNYGTNPDLIYWNNGDGTFTDSGQSIISNNDTYGELADLDGDGDLDIFVVAGGYQLGTISTWENDGTGVFSLMDDFDTSYNHTGVALGDLDNDGDVDAFTAGWGNTYNKVWLNDGAGNFAEAQANPNSNTYTVLLGDLDSDGDLDAYLANITTDVSDLPDEVWLNDGTGHFTNSGQVIDDAFSPSPALGDLDADGDLDVYMSEWMYLPDKILINDGIGNFTLGRTMEENFDGAFVSLGDLDNDGSLDAFTGNSVTDFYIFLNSSWPEAEPIPFGVAFYGFAQCPNQPNSFYVLSGAYDWGTATNNIWRYDAGTDTWNPLAPIPVPEIAPAAVCYAGHIYDVARYLQVYDIESDIWMSMGAAPRLLYGSAMGVWDGKLYRVGGSTGDFYTPVSNVDVFDIATNQWHLDGGKPIPVAVFAPAYTQVGQYLYVVGGNSTDSPAHNVDRVQRYDMASDTWEQTGFPSARGMGFALAYSGSQLYAMGGDLDGTDYYEETDRIETLDLTTWPDSSWEVFHDSLPYAVLGNSAGFCTEAVTGGEIWSVGGATVDPDMVFDYNYYHPTGEPCVQNIVNLPDQPMFGEGEVGSTVNYTIPITNTGNVVDYYNLFIFNDWRGNELLGGPGPVEPGETITVVVSIDVPADAELWDELSSTVRVESLRDPNIMDAMQLFTTVTPTYAVNVEPELIENSGIYGDVITYTLTVTNAGNITDTITLTSTENTWEVMLSTQAIELGAGESADIWVSVTIPDDAWVGDSDIVSITATSTGDPTKMDDSELLTTAFWYRTLIPLAMKN
jgi:N-acetylneuraminic acid mutarotase